MPASLQKKLDALRNGFEKSAPPEVLEVMHAATQALVDSGQAGRARGEGQAAPAFELPDSQGRLVRSRDLLAQGPLVVTFFRGHW